MQTLVVPVVRPPDGDEDGGGDATVVLRWRTAMARRCGICPRGRCTFAAAADGQGLCAVGVHEYADYGRRGSPDEAVIVALPGPDAHGARPLVVAVRGESPGPAAEEAVVHRLSRAEAGDGPTLRAVVLPPATDLPAFLSGRGLGAP